MISDAAVHKFFLRSQGKLPQDMLAGAVFTPQIFRGSKGPLECEKYFIIYNKRKIIPKACFDCYKVLVNPETVVDFFRLLMIFNDISLPNDVGRKCMVETRRGAPGAYKGFIYCTGVEETRIVYSRIRAAVDKGISPDLPVRVKRGHWEWEDAYPTFSVVGDDGNPIMPYPEEWQAQERDAETTVAAGIEPMKPRKSTKKFTRDQAMTMRFWLYYAALKGDETHAIVSGGFRL